MNDSGRRKVLVLTYYWPPSGGAGVQRWLKFTKYLREFHYEPVIYTAEDPEYPSIDESLHHDVPPDLEVLRTRVWEPYRLYKWFTFQKKGYRINSGFLNQNKRKGPAEKISVWIRGNCFVPDARKFWIKPSIRFLTRYLKDHPVSLLVSTGPPHSLHLIARSIAEKQDIPWVADFRDPWTRIDFYKDLMLGKRANHKHHFFERQVLQSASAVTVISKDMAQQFEEMGCTKIRYIPNGFDPDDFDETYDPGELDREFSITHVGTIVPTRNPEMLWQVLSELVSENEDFARDLSIKLIGAMDHSVSRSLKEADLDNFVNHIDYLPHREAVNVQRRSLVLLLLVNQTPNAKGILTGKLFEYMCSGRPILAIGPPDGEAAEALGETGTGQVVDFNERDTLKKVILEYYRQYREGKLKLHARNLERYSRKSLTGEMAGVFDELLINQ